MVLINTIIIILKIVTHTHSGHESLVGNETIFMYEYEGLRKVGILIHWTVPWITRVNMRTKLTWERSSN